MASKINNNRKILLGLIITSLVSFVILWTGTTEKRQGTLKIYDKNGVLLFDEVGDFGSNLHIKSTDIPQNLKDAVIATEDATFFKNPGFDLIAIIRSFYLNLLNKKIVSGASTITQQYVRMAVFNTEDAQKRSYIGKVREILTAAKLSLFLSKEEILLRYLNSVYLGNGSYGVESASRKYFKKSVSSLSLAEAAFLSGMIASPSKYNPYTNFKEAKQRQEYVLDLMLKENFINEEQLKKAKEEVLYIFPDESFIRAPHFVSYIKDELAKFNINSSGGIKVFTTLDYFKYERAREISNLWVNKLGSEHNLTNASIVMLDNNTGAIEVMLGGVNYFDGKSGGESNMAVAKRQPGSAIKPITYFAAFMQGFTPATPIEDIQKVYPTKTGEGFTPRNYDNKFHGTVLVREALASSLNVPAVEVLHRIGISKFLETAKALGITTFKRTDKYDLAITLGGGEITLLELSNAYASFARGGKFLPTYSIEKVETDDGKIIHQQKPPEGDKVYGEHGEKASYLINDILSDPKARMLGFSEKNPLVLSHKAAVKTGTTTDWHDIWAIGYTPDYTVGVWVGNNDNTPMTKVSGVTGAAPIWNQFFEEVIKGMPDKEFTKPEGIITKWICKDTGLPLSGDCDKKIEEIFAAGTEPSTSGASNTKQTESFISILNPKNKAVFLHDKDFKRNTLQLEARASEDIVEIKWYINEGHTGTSSTYPFILTIQPNTGNYLLKAKGITKDNRLVESEIISFEVVDDR